ncbi:DUF1963 domain-containing protein [Chryseobacterium binzhouense]|uniref:DUF1963 domain-containing protein n=1 Tax=Chryseobacterium binzhouense TaxID=2593646 RepID=UPI00289FE43B|nr:DUF1963 domain-containing protein [Chryseobacterium binzhouense]
MFKNTILELIDEKIIENKEVIKTLLREGVGFKIESKEIGFSSSKIGGQAPISDEQHPFLGIQPLTFIAQIDLNNINKMSDIMPKNGILCFFIYTGDLGYRYPSNKDEFKVLYLQDITQINNQSLIKKENTIEEYPISFFEYYTFPSYQEDIIKKNNITDEEINIISDIEEEIMYSINEDFEIPHQLLGHPNALQGTVRFWWASKYLGFDDNSQYSAEEIKLIEKEEENFILLLQLNFGDPKIEIDGFGDSIAYFGIHKKDLEANDFENVILVMQNT